MPPQFEVAAAQLRLIAQLEVFGVEADARPANVGGSAQAPPVEAEAWAELSDRLGSGVLRLEGTLTRSDSVDLVMNVWRVAQISGPTSRWSGESVRLKREYASRVRTRTLDRGRTFLVAGAVVAGIYLFTSQFELLGFGSEEGDPGEGPGPISSRGWWP